MSLDRTPRFCLATLIVLLTISIDVTAQEPPTVDPAATPEPPTTQTDNVTPPASEEQTTPPPEPEKKPNPCDYEPELKAWIDTVHSSLYRFSCSTVSWFDGLFGSRPFENEYRNTHGTVAVGGKWSQRESFDKTLRFRARVYFPQISNQFNAFVGRADRTEVVNESQTELFDMPTPLSVSGNESVFMGLGFNEKMKKRGSFDFDAGVRISEPLDPYVRGSYRFTRPVGERDLLRFRENIFWQEREGFGTSALVEWNHVFNKTNLLRWSTSGTFSQNSIGIRWYSETYYYHLVNTNRAFAYQLFATGSSRYEVPVTDYGASVIFRQRIFRKWLFVELRAGLDWPRYALVEERKANPNGALVFDMRFGRE